MVALRGATVLLLLMCVGIASAGCSTSAKQSENAPPTSADAAAGYDLARLSEVKDDFPPDFTPSPFGAAKLDPAYVDLVGAVVSYGKPFTVDPQECRALLKPVDGQVGAVTNGSLFDGPNKQSIAVNADAPVTVPAEIPGANCYRMTFDVQNHAVRTRGTAERITAPAIDGAVTEALKIQADGYPDVEYYYAAILDDRLYVNVAARVDPSFAAQPLLPDLLVKAVAAVRGR
ncbi:MAG: hypothetical protein QOI25_4977 [Mycobacterium sp.]|jgi:hypothetical protein|nr:hypothetical protein [Mycobacterium sp.]MDT5325641.1 hypothetical protein [Mycobacterium sp.]